MIKVTMVCTNCKEEKVIPDEELRNAILLDKDGELHLCSDCEKLWAKVMAEFKAERDMMFSDIQKRFGIPKMVE